MRNLRWLLAKGMHCANSPVRDPAFVTIGNPDIIEKRRIKHVPLEPRGTLADYVPFYCTPKSPMLYNILTGHNGIARRSKDEILVLVTSVTMVLRVGGRLLFTDRHALMSTAHWFDDPSELATRIDWTILQRHDFSWSDTYPDRKDRYQAEALVYRYVPVRALIGIVCVSTAQESEIADLVKNAELSLPIRVRPDWYF